MTAKVVKNLQTRKFLEVKGQRLKNIGQEYT